MSEKAKTKATRNIGGDGSVIRLVRIGGKLVEAPPEVTKADLEELRFRNKGFLATAEGRDKDGKLIGEGGLIRREAIGLVADCEWLLDRVEYLEAIVARRRK